MNSLYSLFIERIYATLTPVSDDRNVSKPKTNITKESRCKYNRIDRVTFEDYSFSHRHCIS